MSRVVVAVALLATLVAIATLTYLSLSGVQFHCGRCGSQKWESYLLGIDLETDYDEYGIAERWAKAHKQPCDHLWIRGPMGEFADEKYWPPLHFAIAVGRDISLLRASIRAASNAELSRRDALGRSVLHWLVVHPDAAERESMIQEVVTRGLSMDDKDSDSLTPRDWASNYSAATNP